MRIWNSHYISIAIIGIFMATKVGATTLFGGSFVPLAVPSSEKKVSINKARFGKQELCGIELKSNVIVLNTKVWQQLASLLDVQEIHDDRVFQSVEPSITTDYSPRLRYVFSRLDADYSTFVFRSKDGSNLRDIAKALLGKTSSEVGLVAVGYSCN
jgi:hypothetical protein